MTELPIERHRRQHWPFNAPFTVEYSEVRRAYGLLGAGLLIGVLGALLAAVLLFGQTWDLGRVASFTFSALGIGGGAIVLIVGAGTLLDVLFGPHDVEEDHDA
ncbi:hypothetical protein [Vitreimonas flagellata]|uniref:hypothetical protein n=1 Tax=Vitreimonas flagellata TaxID=2560861 RepID=UPI00107556C5|nr:hypothetical protein [Vitreimonas flagellata]